MFYARKEVLVFKDFLRNERQRLLTFRGNVVLFCWRRLRGGGLVMGAITSLPQESSAKVVFEEGLFKFEDLDLPIGEV